MLIKDVAKRIQDDLHDIASDHDIDIAFNITDNIQKYASDMKNADENSYTPGVLKMVGSPFVFSSLDIEVRYYELRLYGFAKERHAVEKLFNIYKDDTKVATTIGDKKVFMYVSSLLIDEFVDSQDGYNVKRYEARVDVEIQILPHAYEGSSVTVKVDGNHIPFRAIQYRKDISLVSNIQYGDNNSDVKMVSDNMVVEIPVIDNPTVQELLSRVLGNKYNKKYLVEWSIGGLVKTFEIILRTGFIGLINNSSPMTFSVTLEIALPRKFITIDNVTFPVLRYAFTGEKMPSSVPRETEYGYITKTAPLRNSKTNEMVIVLPYYESLTFSGIINANNTYEPIIYPLVSHLIPNVDDDITISLNDRNMLMVNKGNSSIEVYDKDYYMLFDNFGVVHGDGERDIMYGALSFEMPKTLDILKAQQMIDDLKNSGKNRVYAIIETIMGKSYTTFAYLIRGSYQSTENPDLILECLFLEADGA